MIVNYLINTKYSLLLFLANIYFKITNFGHMNMSMNISESNISCCIKGPKLGCNDNFLPNDVTKLLKVFENVMQNKNVHLELTFMGH